MNSVVQSRKNHIEKLHLDFLMNKFYFLYQKDDLDSGEPDLFGASGNVFELKSRMYPASSDKSSLQYSWWSLSREQIKRFESREDFNQNDYFWIFMLCYTDYELLDYQDNICENEVLKRDVYIAPWDSYKKFDKGSKYINVGKNGLISLLGLKQNVCLETGNKLFLPKNLEIDFRDYV